MFGTVIEADRKRSISLKLEFWSDFFPIQYLFFPLFISSFKINQKWPSFAAEHKKINNWELSSKFRVSLQMLIQNQIMKSTIAETQVNWKLKTFRFSGVSNLGFPNSGSKLIFTSFLKQTRNFTNPKTAILVYFQRPFGKLPMYTIKIFGKYLQV